MPDIVKEYKVYHEGWDIPTKVILDSDGNIWMDTSHGSEGFKNKHNKGHYTKWLMSYQASCDEEFHELAGQIRKHFNMKPKVPAWIVWAIKEGWTPPASFNRDDYDWP